MALAELFPEPGPVDEVVIAAATGAAVAAFYADHALVGLELGGPRTDRRLSEIALGRVRRVDRELAAAFVDIGDGMFGFLNRADCGGLDARGRLPGEGEAVVVQISREAEGTKLAKLTSAAVLPGRILIYRPGRAGLLVSRRIGDEAPPRPAARILPRPCRRRAAAGSCAAPQISRSRKPYWPKPKHWLKTGAGWRIWPLRPRRRCGSTVRPIPFSKPLPRP